MARKSLKIFVTGDSPRSLKKITLFNWSGFAFLGTRNHKKQIEQRQELTGTGVYFLFSDPVDGIVQMYIGETDNFSKRIKDHILATDKEWWSHFIAFQANDNLNKAHVRFLEKYFWEVASKSPEIEVKNSAPASGANLSEEDQADLEIFKENILYILEALNLGYFQTNEISESQLAESHIYATNTLANQDQSAYMVKVENTYILKAGSHICLRAKDSFQNAHGSYFQKWKEIVESSDVKKVNADLGVLQRDLEFTSPSVCGAIVKARATNGLTAWRNETTGKTLKEELAE
ncbi:GIY-YIG nuclease family protein [Bdellovibrio sp.]|uniref:GIY-YIG nuclease family protein n=1 Tax=Bdellovibrio sp. TaxID=28201 RepID=UPI0039E54CEC